MGEPLFSTVTAKSRQRDLTTNKKLSWYILKILNPNPWKQWGMNKVGSKTVIFLIKIFLIKDSARHLIAIADIGVSYENACRPILSKMKTILDYLREISGEGGVLVL